MLWSSGILKDWSSNELLPSFSGWIYDYCTLLTVIDYSVFALVVLVKVKLESILIQINNYKLNNNKALIIKICTC